ncbi:LPS-assembly protein LptD [Deinococcus alpinitundrae]|uniref:LPS-assembly protein LptD n=1 Tax=Deinococcus alpinitundrae TaxID=468913 RepID=UPI001379AAAF|nr:LPS-assembly protein LptD [Deinococcus alpinitundrae]
MSRTKASLHTPTQFQPRRAAALVAGLLALGLGSAQARTVRIIQADRLELNKVDDQEIVVISGERVELRVDDDVVVATRVEFNRSRRTLTLIGPGRYDAIDDKGAVQHLAGSDLVVNLGNQAVSGEDVIISDANLEIRGEAVERVPGQLSAQNSYFTPCAKCGRTPNDYAFKAKRLLLYPGDRLIGYEATLLLAGVPVLYLPIVALPLNEPSRQPKLSYTNDAVDGRTFKADLPFAFSNNVLGTTFLRYYQNRSPSFGGGGEFTVYAPLPSLDRLSVSGLAEPNPVNPDGTFTTGYAVNYSFAAKGHADLENTAPGGLVYSVAALRQDIGLDPTDTNKGVTSINGQADVTLTNIKTFGNVKVNVTVADRRGPEPTTALSAPLKKPEVVLDPDPYLVTYRNGSTLSADFRITAGNYVAASNPLSRAASLQGPNYATARLQEEHQITYLARPWRNADLNVTNTFTGRYYLSGQRVVDLSLSASLTQAFGVRMVSGGYTPTYNAYGTALNLPSSAGSFTVGYKYLRREGVSPFAFDRVDSKLLSAPLGAALNLTPGSGVAVRLSQDYDLILPADQQTAADLNVSVAQEPVQLGLDVKNNFFKGSLESVTANGSFGASAARGLNVSFSGSYTALSGPGPFTTSVRAIGGVRTNTFGVSLVQDLQKRELQSVTVSAAAVATRDAVINPVTLSLNETVNLQSPHLDGNLNVNWRGYAFSSTHSLTLPKGTLQNATAQNAFTSDTLFFSVGNVPGGYSQSYGSASQYSGNPYSTSSFSSGQTSPSSLTWNLQYGGPYDLATTGWTRPTLTGALTAARPAQRISAQATLALPGSQQKDAFYVQSASLSGDWQFGRRVALSGLASYTRAPVYGPNQPLSETLSLQPLAFNFTFGQSDRPDAALTATFQQTLTWVNGVRTDTTPLQPVLLLTVDRCCWAFQAEINPVARRFRVGLVIPGSGNVSAFENTAGVSKFPIFNLNNK